MPAPAVDERKSHRVAVIDLGSNTARVILINAVPGYSFRLGDEIREVVRRRQGMTADGLSPEGVECAWRGIQPLWRC